MDMNQAVTNGIAYLNENIPNWLDKINLDTLDEHSPTQCVIGQITGRNYRHYFDEHLMDADAIELGFYLPAVIADTHIGMSQAEIDDAWGKARQQEEAEYAALTEAWKSAIAALQ